MSDMDESDVLHHYRRQLREWLNANLSARDPNAGLRGGHDITAQELAADRAVRRRIFDAGYMGITWPTEYGGQGLTSDHQQIWNEESQAYAVPLPGGIAGSVTLGIVGPTLMAHGTEAQKREWVPKLLSGEEIWVQLLSEPGAGSDLAGVLTRASRDGETWVLSGTKLWSSGAMCADYGICLARTDWDAPKHRGLTWFKVPMRDPQMTVRPVREINGSSEFCEEFLDDVVVSDDMRIGALNDGWSIANTMLAFERGAGGHGRVVAPAGRRELAPDLVALARRRGVTGDGHVRQLIARAHIDDYMYEQLGRRVSTAIRLKVAVPMSASYIKLARGVLEPQRVQAAMEIAGRPSIAWHPDDEASQTAATNYLNGRIYAIAGGSNQIQRNIISERLLGLPREPGFDTDRSFREVLDAAKNWGAKST